MLRLLAACLIALVYAFPAFAGQSEAREVARLNNCPPKKIEVVQNYPGGVGKVVYKVSCNLPKTTEENKEGADAILIQCDQSLCSLIRSVAASQK